MLKSYLDHHKGKQPAVRKFDITICFKNSMLSGHPLFKGTPSVKLHIVRNDIHFTFATVNPGDGKIFSRPSKIEFGGTA